MLDPQTLAAAKEELKKSRGEGFEYRTLVGDGAPPLDYTDSIMKAAIKP